MSSKYAAPGVSGAEQLRRARQSANDLGVAAGEQDPQFEAIREQLSAVNLDETNLSFVDIAFIEWKVVEVEDEEGVTHATRKPYTRRVTLCVTPSTEQQLEAIEFSVKRKEWLEAKDDGDATVNREQLEAMARLCLSVWRMTEPDMTMDRFLAGIGGISRISKLFTVFFNPATLQ